MRFGLCLSALMVLFLLVLVLGRVNAQQSSNLSESVSISIDCQAGTVDVSSSEYYFPVNDTSPVHIPSGVTLTNPSDINGATLTFSTSKSTLVVSTLNTGASARSIGDEWATMLSTAFQTNFTYDLTTPSEQVYYNAAGKSSLSQYMQSVMSWCFVADLNGFSPTLVQIASKPGSIITVDLSWSSDIYWGFKVKCSYETSMSTGSGDHTVDVLNLLGVTSLTPSSYSGYYDSIYLTEVYFAAVDVTVTSSQTVTYTSSQPAGLRTDMPIAGVLAPRGWSDLVGSGTHPVFHFEDDSSPANQLTYTFNGVVVPEFPSTMVLSLFMVIFTLAATVAIRRFPRKTKTQN